MKYSIYIICILLLHIVTSRLYAEYRAGYFQVLYPCDKDTVGIDFSELVDSCATEGGFDSCIVLTADILFPITAGAPESLNTVSGILDLGEFDSTGLEHLDTVPTTGYIPYITPVLNHIYAVKTTEEHYAALFFMYEYIGGINRYGFKWAYQSDGTNNLTPTAIKKHGTFHTCQHLYNVNISPSPEGLTFVWTPFLGQINFMVFNSSGQHITTILQNGKKGAYVSTKYYPKGIYFVKSNVSSKVVPILVIK